jgi:2-polyprenyl-6-methoxyphenol hydroxylase-like FAD-dependent oxidoreductase
LPPTGVPLKLGLKMDVLICGAGIAGLTLAFCLERRGHSAYVNGLTVRNRRCRVVTTTPTVTWH